MQGVVEGISSCPLSRDVARLTFVTRYVSMDELRYGRLGITPQNTGTGLLCTGTAPCGVRTLAASFVPLHWVSPVALRLSFDKLSACQYENRVRPTR